MVEKKKRNGIYVACDDRTRVFFERRAEQNRRKIQDEVAIYLEEAMRSDPEVNWTGTGPKEKEVVS